MTQQNGGIAACCGAYRGSGCLSMACSAHGTRQAGEQAAWRQTLFVMDIDAL